MKNSSACANYARIVNTGRKRSAAFFPFFVVVVDFLFCSFPVCWCVVGAGRGNDRRDLSRPVFPIPASFAQVAEFPFSDFAIKFALCLFFAMISNVLESTLHKFLYSNTYSGLEDMVFFSSQFPRFKNDIRIK